MSKRRAVGNGIKAAFARQQERSAAAAHTAAWPSLELPMTLVDTVPEEYTQELTARLEQYVNKKDAIARLVARSATASAQPDRAATPDQHPDVAKWQGHAAFCLQQLSMWPGSGVALHLQQQEALLHITVNADLQSDPLLSSKAYSLLLQNLAMHPPAKLSAKSQGQPPELQTAAESGLCWALFNHSSKPLLQDAQSPFPMLQQLVQNAVRLITGQGARSSSIGGGVASNNSSSKTAASQGQALLLLYVVQLLQADLLVRQVCFERYMALSQTAEQEAEKEEAASRAATVLQHSLLHRVMQDDSVGGDSWRYLHESNRGKHQLVRDLLLLVASSGDAPTATAATRAQRAPAAAAAPAAPADADDDAIMQDVGAAAAAPAALGPTTAAAAAAAAAWAPAAGTVPERVPPVSAQELVQSARVLLLLLLQLYSSCEEAGVYGRGGEGRHHMQRLQGGAGQPNDRFELDAVMMTAIGHCGYSAATFALPLLEQHSNLQRLLLALPPVHRARLLSLMVVAVIHNRVVDPESEGKLALSGHNLVLQDLKEYLRDTGRGYAGFRQLSPLHIVEAVDARLEWAAKEMFGGNLLFALLVGTLISSAAITLRQAPVSEQEAFSEAAARILDHVLLKGRDGLMLVAVAGHREALAALAAAKQQLPS